MEYQSIISYWLSICTKVLTRHSLQDEWIDPGYTKKSIDGTPYEEFNKEFGYCTDLVDKNYQKAVRVRQMPPNTSSDRRLLIHMDTTIFFVNNEDKLMEVLVFVCDGYEDTFPDREAAIFTKLFNSWVQPNISYDDMEEIIDQITINHVLICSKH